MGIAIDDEILRKLRDMPEDKIDKILLFIKTIDQYNLYSLTPSRVCPQAKKITASKLQQL